MNTEAPFIVLGVWGVVGSFSWIVWVIATNVRIARVAHTQGRMHADLVEKLGSSQELMGFLQTEAGQRLFSESPPPEPRMNPFNRILGSVQAGIVLSLLGLAFAGLSIAVPLAHTSFIAFGSIAAAIGIGLLISALVSYRLSKSMGLMDRTNDGADS
jgi:type IV secretory pathway VirB6-like protein